MAKNKFTYVLSHNKAWLITTVALAAFCTTLTAVSNGNLLVSNTFDALFGGSTSVLKSGDLSKAQYYTKSEDIKTKEDALTQGNKVNEQICEEGFVLLKNDNALPLGANPKVSVFGMNSVDLVYGGSGSSAKSSDDNVDLYQALDESKISYNPTLKEVYDKAKKAGKGRPSSPSMGDIVTGFATGELEMSEYGGSISKYASGYNDAALMVVTRIGGEGYDLPTTSVNTKGRSNESDHYLKLDDNENALLEALCANDSGYDNVILIVNCGTSMELGFLKDDAKYNNKLKGAIWIGDAGGTGLRALGKILTGEANPSGRLVDTYVKDFTETPSFQNFGKNLNEGNQYLVNGTPQNAEYVDYEEGIYVGYRYYETRAVKDGEDWYNNQVVYPFGYGLSYSDFEWEIQDDSSLRQAVVTKDGNYSIQVKVTNKSKTPGKDVVELYGHAPYTEGGIEKSEEVLVGFAKTKELKENESEVVTITFDPYSLASYDYKGTKVSGGGYVLEKGNDYRLYVSKNAHEKEFTIPFSVNDDQIFTEAKTDGYKVENHFDAILDNELTYMSRSDFSGTFPTRPTEDDKTVTQDFIDRMSEEAYIGSGSELDVGKPWYSERKPRQKRKEVSFEDAEYKIWDLIGKDYDDKTWDYLLNELTYDQLAYLIGTGNYHTSAIETIGLPSTTHADGPAGFTNFMSVLASTATVYDCAFYCSETVQGATFNTELIKELGEAIGDESLVGNERGDGKSYSGWYAPAVNIHRSQFGGRNWEYYSEDPFLAGKMAANEIQGAKSKGVLTMVKHFAANEQETNRDTDGLMTWTNEQALREIYLKPFEYAIKEGKSNGIMTSFNRIGHVWTGGCYELLTDVLRHEWGFQGCVITDYNTSWYMYPDQMIRAGGDLDLMQDKKPSTTGDIVTPSHQTAMRKAAKNILYAVVNSNAMNGYGEGIVYGESLPVWKVAIIAFDCVCAAAMAVWGFFSIRRSLKKYQKEEEKTAE